MPPKSHCFFIKSYLNGLCLDIEGGSREPGARVLMYEPHSPESAHNQLWYMCPYTMTIRNIQDDYCLEVDGRHGRVQPYDPGNVGQRWSVVGQFLLNLDDNGKVLDVVDGNMDNGADICSWDRHGAVNQRWYFEHVPRKYFYIVSGMDDNKCLDIKGGDPGEGAEVIIYDKHSEPSDNQLWYSGRSGIIRSKLNGYVMDSSDGDIKMQNCVRHKKEQGFVFSNGHIVTLHDTKRVLDIKSGCTDNGTNICCWDEHGGENQFFKLQYVEL